MRRLNLAFLAVLLTVTAVFGGGMYVVHATQIVRNASILLDHARRAEANNDLESAEKFIANYINIKRLDGLAWTWYARVVEERDVEHKRRDRVLLVYEQAQMHNPGDLTVARRCAELSLELRLYSNARRHLTELLEKATISSQTRLEAADLAEFEELLGDCDRGLTRFAGAEQWFRQAASSTIRGGPPATIDWRGCSAGIWAGIKKPTASFRRWLRRTPASPWPASTGGGISTSSRGPPPAATSGPPRRAPPPTSRLRSSCARSTRSAVDRGGCQ